MNEYDLDPQFQEDEISRAVAISYANDPTREQKLEN